MPAFAPSVVATGRRAVNVLGLLAALLPAASMAQLRVDLMGRDTMAPPESESEAETPAGWTLERSQTAALAPSHRLPASVAPSASLQPSNAVTQTMLWARRERLALGFGVEQRWVPVTASTATMMGPAVARDAGVLVGVSWATGESSQLTWAAPLLAARQPEGLAWAGLERPEREMRLGLEFRKRDPYAELRRGALMKFELSRDTTVSLKPRHGRVGFTLSSRW